jgi:hypothetical protein
MDRNWQPEEAEFVPSIEKPFQVNVSSNGCEKENTLGCDQISKLQI